MASVEAFTGGQRHAMVTDNDHGPILQIVMWFLMVTMILMTLLKMAVRLALVRDLGVDDVVCVLALFMGIGSTISLSIAVNHGLGERDSVRDVSQTTALQKNIYSASILYLLSITFAKISILMLTKRLSPKRTHLNIVWGVTIFVAVWGFSAIFADAFRCSIPNTYDLLGGDCIDIHAFWNSISAVDVLTDLILIALPIWFFGHLQMSFHTKFLVLFAFACRIFVVAAAITRLVYLSRLHSSSDIFFDSIPFHISTQVQQALSVMVASAPGLKQFMDHANSGMLDASLRKHTGATYGETNRKDTYLLTNISRKSKKSLNVRPDKDVTTSLSATGNGTMSNPHALFRPDGMGSDAMVTSGHQSGDPENGLGYHAKVRGSNRRNYSTSGGGSENEIEIEGEVESLESGSDKMIIKVEKDWKVVPYHVEK